MPKFKKDFLGIVKQIKVQKENDISKKKIKINWKENLR